jgi:molybdopterin-guanine dinucleotide biosynthesis protein A
MFLVGSRAEYADLEHETLEDTPPGVGPLGGLRALLQRTADDGYEAAVALACDLPYVTPELVARLASEQSDAVALAPHEADRWYALTARYSIALLPEIDEALARQQHSLQKLFAGLGAGARRLAVDEGELASLRDWDSPEDLAT